MGVDLTVVDVSIDVVRRYPADVAGHDAEEYHRPLEFGILRVLTKDGIEGHCIVGEFWGWPQSYFDPLNKTLKPQLMGKCATQREWLWSRHIQLHKRFQSTDPVWAALDIALWDIAGKAAGLPIYKLLGAQRDAVPAYATYPWKVFAAEDFVAELEDAISRGFPAYKSHPGGVGTRETCRAAELLRKRAGDELDLMLDPNGDYDFRKALEVGSALDAAGFFWFEDALAYHDLDALAELSRRLKTPLCMTDQAPQQLFQSARYIRANAARMVRGTALRLGVTGLKKLCAMAEGFGINCEIGTGGNPLTNAANLHVMQSVNNCAYYENMLPGELERFALTGYIEPDAAGLVRVPDRPGLGFDLDEDWIASHKIASLR
jgi:L-alanine-DL-glutamate epimerase-like enolase superfamily enzyme